MTTLATQPEHLSGFSPDSHLINHDLAPVTQGERSWSTVHYLALWVALSVNIPTYMIASSLIQGGMNVMQAVLTVLLGNVIVLIPMVLNGHVGVKYGIPFPVFARASFGTLGANIPALLRAIVGCGWFGIQCSIGGSSLYKILTILWPASQNAPTVLPEFLGISLVPFACFMAFWAINVLLIMKGIEAIKQLQTYCAPVLILCGLGLLFWAVSQVGGFGPIFAGPGRFTTASEFWAFFFPSLTGMAGFWATLSLNIPDFTRYGTSQKAQVIGQTLGLPTTMTLFAFIGIAVTTASTTIFGETLWDPVILVGRLENPWIVVPSLLLVCLTTLTMNVAANIVAPANDIANVCPEKINFRKGGMIAAVIGILILPWKLVADPSAYIFTWLIGYSALLGPLAGILMADYFILRRAELSVNDLYRSAGQYQYQGGYNIIALIALLIGVLPNLPGFLLQIKAIDALSVPLWLSGLYNYAWFVGLLIAAVVYCSLMSVMQPQSTHSTLNSEGVSG